MDGAGALRLDDDLAIIGQQLGDDYSGQAGRSVTVEESRLVGARFTGTALPRLRLSDVVVSGADFSGADLEEASMTRAEFVDCRLSGILMPMATLRDVTFSGCRIDGANLRRLTAERVRFVGCDLHDTELSAARLQHTCFYDCDLTRVEISQTELGGTRFGGSSLADLRGAEYFKDAVIDASQVYAVALGVLAASGVRIEDERQGLYLVQRALEVALDLLAPEGGQSQLVGHQQVRRLDLGRIELADAPVQIQVLAGDGLDGSHDVGPGQAGGGLHQCLAHADVLGIGLGGDAGPLQGGGGCLFGAALQLLEHPHLARPLRFVGLELRRDAAEEDLAQDLALVGLDPQGLEGVVG